MTSKAQIEVENKLISIVKQDEQDYICQTDMVRDEEGTHHIRNWVYFKIGQIWWDGTDFMKALKKVSDDIYVENKKKLE